MRNRLLPLCILAGLLSPAAVVAKPNIVVILSDDMGYSDLGCYGGEIQTPVLDGLSRGGIRFTQFYNTARCCPTRAALLTGLYPHQAGMGHMTSGHPGNPAYAGNLNRNCLTLAEQLKPAGYRAYMCGKWHLTRHERRPDDPRDTWPLQRGFDRFYGTITGAGSFYDPTTLCRGNTFITPENDEAYQPKQYYYTDAIADNAVAFLQEHREAHEGAPFFLYLAFTAAHWPMHALPEDIAKYAGKYDAGYDPIRAARLRRGRDLGVLDPLWPLSPAAGDWSHVQHPAWEAQCMEVYAAMIDRMDQAIGRVVATLQAQGQLDDTLILFMQDNGGCAEEVGRQSNADKIAGISFAPLGRDGLQPQVTPPMQTRDGRPVRTGPGVMPGPEDTYIAYGRGWANVSNTPFREYKHWVHEGGISTPLIVHWPAGLTGLRTDAVPRALRRTESGWLCDVPTHLIDIARTCLDVAGGSYPEERDGQPLTPLQGISLRPAWEGRPLQRGRPLFWEHEGNRAARDGRWKLVAKGPAGAWELYDIEADRSELHDLAGEHPERVRELREQWETWAHAAGVLPWVWQPAYGDAAAKPAPAKQQGKKKSAA